MLAGSAPTPSFIVLTLFVSAHPEYFHDTASRELQGPNRSGPAVETGQRSASCDAPLCLRVLSSGHGGVCECVCVLDRGLTFNSAPTCNIRSRHSATERRKAHFPLSISARRLTLQVPLTHSSNTTRCPDTGNAPHTTFSPSEGSF